MTSLQRGLIRVLCVGAECGREGEGEDTYHCVWARNAEGRGKGEDTCHTDLPAKKIMVRIPIRVCH